MTRAPVNEHKLIRVTDSKLYPHAGEYQQVCTYLISENFMIPKQYSNVIFQLLPSSYNWDLPPLKKKKVKKDIMNEDKNILINEKLTNNQQWPSFETF